MELGSEVTMIALVKAITIYFSAGGHRGLSSYIAILALFLQSLYR